MGTFVKGSQLIAEVEKLFEEADQELVIISPYIKLHSRLIETLKPKLDDPELSIILVYGKNEADKSKSLNKVDFQFFSQFANIKIYYEPRLHAKYYGNQEKGILSSMNLYEYSMNNNIEFGVVTKANKGNLDKEAWNYFQSVIEGSVLEYEKIPIYESSVMGLSKKYLKSEVKVDALSKAFNIRRKGFCIRTGEPIKFNLEKPFTEEAFKSWSLWNNWDFKEKYCHFSGESSNGETSMRRPVLEKYWDAARKEFEL